MEPLFINDNSINFLKNEFGDKYSNIFVKIVKDNIEHAEPLMYHEYKNYAIVGVKYIYDLTKYKEWLMNKNVQTISIKLF